jgi:hypothetical protein
MLFDFSIQSNLKTKLKISRFTRSVIHFEIKELKLRLLKKVSLNLKKKFKRLSVNINNQSVLILLDVERNICAN